MVRLILQYALVTLIVFTITKNISVSILWPITFIKFGIDFVNKITGSHKEE
jgi:hypothetical protein